MKTLLYLILVAATTFFFLGLSGCTSTEVVAPDGTITRTKAPSPGVLPFAAAALTAYSSRPIIVREEKGGRITKEETDCRWKAAEQP